tara:strand:+ start:1327 stop:1521 length:195 start_codon:yes stop_codon:yes gene_type:complete
MVSNQEILDSDAILAIEARGFIFGSAIAYQSGKPIVVVRKPNTNNEKIQLRIWDKCVSNSKEVY